MAQDADRILVGANGNVYVGAVGSTAPTNATTAPDAAFNNLGLITPNGITKSVGKTVQDIRSWQLLDPARRIVTERDVRYSFELQQWELNTVEFAFSATVSEPSAGVFKVTPNDPETLDEWALIVDWVDGARNYRAYSRRGTLIEAVETNLVRTAEAVLPVTFAVLGESGEDPWVFFTDDDAFDPTP